VITTKTPGSSSHGACATTRKRRIRLIYSGNTLYSLMSQGSSVGEYERWLSMLNYCHLTFRLGLFDPTQVS